MKNNRQNTSTKQAADKTHSYDRALEMLLDDTSDTVVLNDEFGDKHTFQKIAAIPYANGDKDLWYMILRPLDEPVVIADYEAYAFRTDMGKRGELRLFLETNERRLASIFDKFFAALDGARLTDNKRKEG